MPHINWQTCVAHKSSEASRRKIILPELIIRVLRQHLDRYSPSGPEDFVFVGVKGGQLRRSNFSKPWARALAKADLLATCMFTI